MTTPTFHYAAATVAGLPIDADAVPRFLAHRSDILDTARDMVDRAHVDYGVDAADIGTVIDVARSLVDRIAQEATRAVRRPYIADTFTGDSPDDVSPAPDHYDRVKADTVQERSNRGVTVKRVTVHGRGYVGGSTSARDATWHGPTVPHAATMSAAALAHAIDTAPRTALGHVDGVALARLTAVAFPDVPDMLGGDVLTWHERPTYDETLAATPRRGWPTRYRLPTVRARSGESTPDRATVVLANAGDVPEWRDATVSALLAPSHRADMAWRGHVLAARPDTVRQRRAERARRTDDVVTVPDGAVLADVLAGVAAAAPCAPYRVQWSHRGRVGFVTVTGTDRRPRYSVTGLPVAVRGQRSPRGIRAAVSRATS